MTTSRRFWPTRAATLFCVLLALACGADAPEGNAQSTEPRDGTYRVAFQGQALTLTLVTRPDGGVAGRLLGPTVDFSVEATRGTDRDGDPAVEGVMTGGGATGLFWLYLDDDDEYGLIVTPLDAVGTPLPDQAAHYAVERTGAEVLGAAPDARPSTPGGTPGASGHPIIGRWATQVVMSSPAGSIATQMFMEFRPDGTMVDLGSRAMGGFGDASLGTGLEGGGDRGAWRVGGELLYVSYQGSAWVPFARYQVDAARLALVYIQDGSTQIWYRQ